MGRSGVDLTSIPNMPPKPARENDREKGKLDHPFTYESSQCKSIITAPILPNSQEIPNHPAAK